MKFVFQKSEHIPYSEVFRQTYAQFIQFLEKFNEYLKKYLEEVNQIYREVEEKIEEYFIEMNLDNYRWRIVSCLWLSKWNLSSMTMFSQRSSQ